MKLVSKATYRRSCVAWLAWMLLTAAEGQAQRYKLVYDPDTPEGQFLELVELQSDQAKRLTLIEQFAERYPKHLAASWVYEQLQAYYLEKQQYDKALAAGEKLIAANPDDFDAVQLNLRAAEAKRDRGLIKKWSDYATKVAQKVIDSPAPKEPIDLEAWKARMTAASQLTAQHEYALYKKALDAPDQKTRVALLDELVKRYPESQYLAQAYLLYFQAYRLLGERAKALATAEKILDSDSSNEDALLALAESHSSRQSEATLTYAGKIIQLMQSKPKPPGIPAAEWDKKKDYYTGTAYWMMGNLYVNQNRYSQADQALRHALARMHSSDGSASILFYLGWSNYKLENYVEALRFYKQCAAIRGQFQEQALKNINVIRDEQKIKD